MLNHSCTPNCERVVEGGRLEVVTVREVVRGEELTISYTDLLLPTVRRRAILATSKHFHCECERCEDGPGEVESGLVGPAELERELGRLERGTDWGDSGAVRNLLATILPLGGPTHHLVLQCRHRLMAHHGPACGCADCRESASLLAGARRAVLGLAE